MERKKSQFALRSEELIKLAKKLETLRARSLSYPMVSYAFSQYPKSTPMFVESIEDFE